MKVKILSLLISLSLLPLAGCQSIQDIRGFQSFFDTKNRNTQPSPTLSENEQAKQQLASTFRSTLKRSFNYNTQLKVSYLEEADQLALNARQTCEREHDDAYVDLLQISTEVDYLDQTQYEDQQAKIRTRYFSCLDHKAQYPQALDNSDTPKDPATEDLYDDNDQQNDTATESEYEDQEDWQDNADKQYKKEVLNAYVIKPSAVNLSGTYQPLAGKFALLPSIRYESHNLLFNQQLPMYIDLKNNNVYLWADFFAHINAMSLDETLGVQWQDKWLKFSLADSSLPQDFAKNFIKSYISAFKQAYKQEPTHGFSFVPYQQVKTYAADLSHEDHSKIEQSSRIIARVHNQAVTDQQHYIFQKALLDNLNKTYPNFATNMKNDRKLSLANILYKYFSYVQETIDRYEIKNLDENGNLTIDQDDNKFKNHTEHYYGLGRENKLNWTYSRYLKNDTKFNVNIFTSLTKLDDTIFSDLPEQSRLPHQQNSIDISIYSQQLLSHYKEGNGTPLGKLVYEGYNKYIAKVDDKDTSDESEQDYNAESTTKIITIEPDTRTPIGIESANCVLISLNLDMMCDADQIDINNPILLKECKTEQQELNQAYQEYCKK